MIKGYHIFIMLVVCLDLIMYFINKDNILTADNKSYIMNLGISIFITTIEFVDLIVVASYGIRQKVRWFTISYILYSLSCLSYLVTYILMLSIDYSFYKGIAWQFGFLSIFRG